VVFGLFNQLSNVRIKKSVTSFFGGALNFKNILINNYKKLLLSSMKFTKDSVPYKVYKKTSLKNKGALFNKLTKRYVKSTRKRIVKFLYKKKRQ